MLVLAGKVHYLRHFGFSDLLCKYAAFADAVMMDMQHDLGRRVTIFVEELLDHMHHEFHRDRRASCRERVSSPV